MNAKKIIFLLFVLISFILLYYYIDVDNIDDITPYIEFGTIVSEEI